MTDKILEGKVAVITGANQGLGLEIAKHYLKHGANLALCARNEVLLEQCVRALEANLTSGQIIFWRTTDVSKSNEIETFVESILSQFKTIDILVNNAGVYGPKGNFEEVNWDEWLRAVEINLFGSVLMSRAVVPIMKSNRNGRIIQISGGGATNPMPLLSAYAVSKAAVIRFMETLSQEVASYGIEVNAIAPGALNTRLLDEVIKAGPDLVGDTFYQKALIQKEVGGTSMNFACELALFLVSQESSGISGKLISAIWDDWQDWPNHIQELRESDVYTLRRVTARDRGLKWGDK